MRYLVAIPFAVAALSEDVIACHRRRRRTRYCCPSSPRVIWNRDEAIHEVTIPAYKQLKLVIRIGAQKENKIVVDDGQTVKDYRNTPIGGEVRPPNPLTLIFRAISEERLFKLYAKSKDCNTDNNPNGCPTRDWYPNYGPVVEEETDTHHYIWWDDSNRTPQYENVSVEVFIS